MTTVTDPAAVILDRAAAGKPLTTDEIRILRADREHLQELVARRSEIFRAYRDRQNTDHAEIKRLERKVRDLEAHLHFAHQNVRTLRDGSTR